MIKKILYIFLLISSSVLAFDIDISNAKNRDVIKLVSEITGQKFVFIGAESSGRISLVGEGLNKFELLTLLHESLSGLGIGLMHNTDHYKVVNLYKAISYNPPFVDNLEGKVGFVSYIINENKIKIINIHNLINPMAGAGNKIILNESLNNLLISDDVGNIKKMISIIDQVNANIVEDGRLVIKIMNGGFESILDKVKELDGGVLKIIGDDSSSQIILSGHPSRIAESAELIKSIDIEKKQIMIEAIIAEISSSDGFSKGMQLGLSGNMGIGLSSWRDDGVLNLGDILQTASQDALFTTPVPEGGGMMLGFNGGGINFGVLVQAIKRNGTSNILSTPSILTMDGMEAEIIVGKNVPFLTATGSAEDNPYTSIKREDVGLKLKVRPVILSNNKISLEIEQEISSISKSTNSTNDIITDKRYLKTMAVADNNSAIVLGGLMDATDMGNEKKVPILGDLPWIGQLFRYESGNKEKRKLLIFIKPTIITDKNKNSILQEALNMQSTFANPEVEGLDIMSVRDIILKKDKTLTEYYSIDGEGDF